MKRYIGMTVEAKRENRFTEGGLVPNLRWGWLILIAVIAGAMVTAFLQPNNAYATPNFDDCDTDTVWLNTGYDQLTGDIISIGSGDPYWSAICDPDGNTTEPRPAFVIPTYRPGVCWAYPQLNSQWISSYDTAEDDLNGVYCFEFCFCVIEPGPLPNELNLCLRADDTASVYLNGNKIGHTDYWSWHHNNPPTCITVTGETFFVPGINCVEVKVENLHQVAMGLNLVGFVTGPGYVLLKQYCCDSTSQIQGLKWNDDNGDGIKQPGEPGLSGWTINLSNGMQAITDGLGYYYFNNLIPGTYTITETPQAGWTQTCPTTGSYTVTLSANQVETGLDFGNKSSGSPPIPTLSEWGMIIFGVVLLGFITWVFLKKRKVIGVRV